MTISRVELIEEFGRAADLGNAAIFIGAGLSRGVGLPGWGQLLDGPAKQADVPIGGDLPLVAEYVVLSGNLTDEQLASSIRTQILEVGAKPGPAHRNLARLPVDQIWTTNYDTLIEDVCTDDEVVVADFDVTRVGATRRSVIKMHGSINATGWAEKPVITRKHYEEYQQSHPRTWALLRATYLSRTMLFLGFSFTDPNIDILLQLARTLNTSVGDRHMAVMRRPGPGDIDVDPRLHSLRVRDLEGSGVRILEIDDFSDLDALLAALVRRTRPTRLFVSGSFEAGASSPGAEACRAIAAQLAERREWTLVSLGGPSGWRVSQQVGAHRRAEDSYEAQQFEFHFREASHPPEPPAERLGTAFYHAKTREALVPWLLDESRAMLVVGGGTRTLEEIAWADAAGVPVIPLAYSGGSARTRWQALVENPPSIGGQPTSRELWERLGNTNPDIASRAGLSLLDRAMYHDATRHPRK